MEYFKLFLGPINGNIKVKILRKKIKNVHLKVFRTLDVSLSVPEQASEEWINTFLYEHIDWIDEQIDKYKKTKGNNSLSAIHNGTSTQIFGKDMRIYKESSSANRVEIDEKRVILYLKDCSDIDLANRVIAKWWRTTALNTYQRELDNLYDKIFKKYDVEKPSILVKKMKTLWGSCTPEKNRITINEYLLKADIRCIQYVILHELTHLIYPNHSTQFYDFLTIQMPDWIERKKQLDTEVVQGL